MSEWSTTKLGLQAVGDELAEEMRAARRAETEWSPLPMERTRKMDDDWAKSERAANPHTVKSAIARLEELLARLGTLDEAVSRIATVVGGPIPVSTATGIGAGPAGSVVERLSELADACHARVSDVEHGFAALGRALGADDA